MKKLTKILRKEEKGFTLIELIVVIAILGIIAAIAVPQYMGTVNNAKNKADQATAQNIADAAARYINDNCKYDGTKIVEVSTPSSGAILSDNTINITNLVNDHYMNNPKIQTGGSLSATATLNNDSTSDGTVNVKIGTDISASANFELISY